MSIDLNRFKGVYFEESFENLEVMENTLLSLDVSHPDSEEVNSIFRAAHSIKGGSGTFGFNSVAEFTHVVEALLERVRAQEHVLSQDDVDLLLKSTDCLREMLLALQDESEPSLDEAKSLQHQLEQRLNVEKSENEESSEVHQMMDTLLNEEQGAGWCIFFKPHESVLTEGNEPFRLLRELSDIGESQVTAVTTELPAFEALEPTSCYLAWDIVLKGEGIDEAKIKEIFEWVADDSQIDISPLAIEKKIDSAVQEGPDDNVLEESLAAPVVEETRAAPAVEQEIKSEMVVKDKGKAPKKIANDSSIRVAINKVDELINMVGELVITQSMLSQMGQNFSGPDSLASLQQGLMQLEHNTRELQESVMQIRMLPISFVFSRFPRMVRDVSKQLGKNIHLEVLGEQTELDKIVMEKIGDPLVHLVRNAIDHGIETEEERKAQGKPLQATVTLNAYHQGGKIVIEVQDDGKGIDCEKIFNKAVEKGLISADDQLSEKETFDLLFHPGFSTAEQVTDLSGRGVGMDVVKRNITALGGSILIESEVSVGTTLKIQLPLTLAILDGQQVRVGEQIYIIPLISIVESLQVKSENIKPVAKGQDVYHLRDSYVPIIKLYEVFNLEPDSKNIEEGLMVVMEAGGQTIGVLVDELLVQQQVVIKNLEDNYKKVAGLSGATILGDGRVALIIEVSDLLDMQMRGIHWQSEMAS